MNIYVSLKANATATATVARTEFTSRLLYSKIVNAMREILRKSMPIAIRVAFATSLRAIFPCLTQVHKWENVNHPKSLQSPGFQSGSELEMIV